MDQKKLTKKCGVHGQSPLEGVEFSIYPKVSTCLGWFFLSKRTSILGFDTPKSLGSLGVGLSECWAVLTLLRES